MGQQVKVDRDLVFQNSAAVTQNVQGPMLETLSHDSDRFTYLLLDTVYRWTVTTNGSTSTFAVSHVQGGSALATPGTADNDSCMMSGSVIYSGANKAICEFRIKIANVSGVTVFVGFTDEVSEINGKLALDYTGATTFRANATLAAGFVIAGEYLESSIMCCSKGTTPIDTAVDWEDGETKTLRVQLDGTTAKYWLDGVQVATIAASAVAATLMCPSVQVMTVSNEGGDVATCNVDRFDAWQIEE